MLQIHLTFILYPSLSWDLCTVNSPRPALASPRLAPVLLFSLLPSEFAAFTGRPAKFCALHFANGIWDANIAEVMPHPGTDPEVVETVLKFSKDINMVPFRIRKEQNGYLINR